MKNDDLLMIVNDLLYELMSLFIILISYNVKMLTKEGL